MVTKVSGDMIAAGSMDGSQLASDSIVHANMGNNSVGNDEMRDNAINTNELVDGAVTAGKLASTLDLSSKTLTLPTANTPAFTKSYVSAAQTITAAGSLTLPHSLGAVPKLVQFWLKCTSTEAGYSVNDEVPYFTGDQNANRGASCMPDATNMNVRFGSAANTFNVLHKTTGVSTAITNANWNLIVKAWA